MAAHQDHLLFPLFASGLLQRKKCNTGSTTTYDASVRVCQRGSPSCCLKTADEATASGPKTQTGTDAAVIMTNGASRIGTIRFLLDKWCNILLFNNNGS